MSERMITMLKAAACCCLLALFATPVLSEGDEELDDPMRPADPPSPAQAPAADPEWILNSTVVSETRRIAIINGQRVSAGSWVDGARVISVRQGRAVIEVDGERREISLRPEVSVRSSNQGSQE